MSNSPAHAGRSVLISGASIPGPALAYWLDRYGFEVTVVEGGAADQDFELKISPKASTSSLSW
jgi:2-polyprenyl-6-methoxyphenol hydroxylase-like FAD-dependent oxidoreductase